MQGVSVVVPIRNEWTVSSGSSIITQAGVDVEVIPITGEMPIGIARQNGVDRATHDLIAFIDSDCVLPDSCWLRRMVDSLGGVIVMSWAPGMAHPDSPWINRYALKTHPLTHPPEIITKRNYTPVGTGHCVIRKDVIEEVGGFKPLAAGEDVDLTRRIVDAGYALRFVPLGVYHYHVKSLWEYYRKYYRNIRAARDNPAWRSEHIEKRPPVVNTLLNSPQVAFSQAISERDPWWLMHPFIQGMKVPLAAAAMLS